MGGHKANLIKRWVAGYLAAWLGYKANEIKW